MLHIVECRNCRLTEIIRQIIANLKQSSLVGSLNLNKHAGPWDHENHQPEDVPNHQPVLPFSVSLATQQAVRHALIPTLLWSFAVGVLRDADSGLARAARATRLCSFTWGSALEKLGKSQGNWDSRMPDDTRSLVLNSSRIPFSQNFHAPMLVCCAFGYRSSH